MKTEVFVEAIVVGIITALLGFIISTALMFTSKKFKLKEYHFWYQVVLAFFLTGFVVHLGCEAFGFNKWYCKNGSACKV